MRKKAQNEDLIERSAIAIAEQLFYNIHIPIMKGVVSHERSYRLL